jgi:thiol:disulfide interchange protein DsbG
MTSSHSDIRCRSRSGAARLFRLAIACAVFAVPAADAKTPSEHDLTALFATLEETDAVVEGLSSSARVLYVFFDANCWFCHLTWKALQYYERAGLQVRWVPVAYQKDSSVGRAAAIMQAKDRAAAMRTNETGYRANSYDGGIRPARKLPPELAAQLEANGKLMERFDSPGTPTLVWKDKSGRVQVEIGMPPLSRLPSITGLSEQKIDDPELKEFR